MDSSITIDNFVKGLDQSLDSSLIPFDMASDLANMDIEDGVLTTSKGVMDYSAVLPFPIAKLMKYYVSSVGTILVVCTNGNIYKLSPDKITWTLVTTVTAGSEVDYINYQTGTTEIMIIANGVDTTKKYDGTTWTDLKNDGMASAAGAGNKAPKGTSLELHKERLWITCDPNAKNTLRASNDFDPDDWTTPITEGEANQHGVLIELPTWDGGVITGIRSMFNDLYIFKTHNVWRIFGSDPTNFTMTQVFDNMDGVIFEKTVASIRGLLFWTSTTGIYLFDGVDAKPMTDRIKAVFASINVLAYDRCSAIVYKDKYILALPTGSNTYCDTVIEYNIKTGAFTVRNGLTVLSFMEFNDMLLYGDAVTNKICQYDAPNTVPTAATKWESGSTIGSGLNSNKIITALYMLVKGTGVVSVTITPDKSTKVKTKTMTLANNSTYTMKKLNIRTKGRAFSLKFSAAAGVQYSIKQPQIVFEEDED